MKQDMIVILDLGGEQSAQIAREVRALGVYSEIHPNEMCIRDSGYSTDLRSKTQGRGQYSMAPSHYAEVPKNIAEGIMAGRKKD